MKILSTSGLLLCTVLLLSCGQEFQPVEFGKDGCAHCRMTIMDKRFASEIVTAKGRAFKFDDIDCMIRYIKEMSLKEDELKLFVADYLQGEPAFIDAKEAVWLHSETFSSPMNGNYAAFATRAAAEDVQRQSGADFLMWDDLK